LKEISDIQILELILTDKSFDEGFEKLVVKYQEKLYWHIRRMVHFHEDADDVIQNTFIKVFKNIKGFQKKSKLYTWIYRIATNEAITFLNKRKKSKNIVQDVDTLEQKLIADEYFDGDQAELKLIKAIELLPAKQKLVFRMRYYQEVPYKEMSEILDTSVGALKASYHHAVKKIENYIKDEMNYV